MKPSHLLATLCTSLIMCTTAAAYPSSAESPTKKRVLSDLDTIRNILDVKYAPKAWKHQFANWDLDASIEQAKNKIESHPAPSLKECQIILRDFFNSTRDYHVGVRFFSTE